MKHLLLSIALLAGTASADQFTCLPAQLGGSGTKAVWGLEAAPAQFWAGWWCDKSTHQLVACVGDGCSEPLVAALVPAFEQAPRRTVKGLNSLRRALVTTELDDPTLRAVWAPHWPEILALRPQ